MSNIKVRAVARGFYGNVLREKGDIFTLTPIVTKEKSKKNMSMVTVVVQPEEQFSDDWMEIVEEKKAPVSKVVGGDGVKTILTDPIDVLN